MEGPCRVPHQWQLPRTCRGQAWLMACVCVLYSSTWFCAIHRGKKWPPVGGLSTQKGTARTVIKKLDNQQQGELAGLNYAAHFTINEYTM